MTYKRTVPQGTDTTDQSARDFQKNFDHIFDDYKVDHQSFDNRTQSEAKHKYFTLPHQAADPTTAANETAIYCKSGNPSSIFVRPESNGSAVQISKENRLCSGLKLEAWVVFDNNGNIINQTIKDPAGGPPTVTPMISNNVTLTKGSGSGAFVLTFDPVLSTAFYFPMIKNMDNRNTLGIYKNQMQIRLGATYADSITTSTLKIRSYLFGDSSLEKLPGITHVEIYTVV